MSQATQTAPPEPQARLGHTRWCDRPEHNLAQQGEPPGTVQCISRPIEVGKVGGWISANVGPEVAIVLDWRPEQEGQFTFAEAQALAAFLTVALHVAAAAML